MRHLAFRFVRHAPEAAGAQFVVDPYFDYRQRLNSNWQKSLEKRKLNVDYEAIKDGYSKWWTVFGQYEKDPSKENKSRLLDVSNGLVDVLKLPNTVVDLNFAERVGQNSVASLQNSAKTEAGTIEWLSEKVYQHLSKTLPNLVRQSPSYRVRPVFLDACNLPELEFPRIAENAWFTSLVGVSLPAQLTPFFKHQFTTRKNFPLNLIAFGASYQQNSSKIEQQSKASLLNVCQEEIEATASFHLITNSISRFFGLLGINYEVEVIKPENLSKFEAASVSFKNSNGSLARISFIGSYISERLNIQVENADKSEDPKFALMCHADLNLTQIGKLLL